MTDIRPDFVTEDMLEYLDHLRKSGATNMFGARPYVQGQYPDLSEREAAQVLTYWMRTFSERHAEAR